jgi:VanZ family protein
MKSKNLHVGDSPISGRERLLVWMPVLMVAAAIFAASSLPRTRLPDVGFPGIDKLEHGIAYGLLGAALARAWTRLRPRWRARNVWIAVWLVALAYGLSDELHQLLVPGRMFDVADLAADVAGAMLGGIAYLWLRRRRCRQADRPLPGNSRS